MPLVYCIIIIIIYNIVIIISGIFGPLFNESSIIFCFVLFEFSV